MKKDARKTKAHLEKEAASLRKQLAAFRRSVAGHKRAEEQLRQAQKMEAVGTLAGGIAHDFNNILTPILSYTDLALRTLPEDSPSRPDLEHVLIAARRAKDLVKRILAFSRRDIGHHAPLALPYLPAIATEAESERPSRPVVGGTERILFVDDEAAVVRSGARMLRMLGYTVTAMDDSRRALDAFRAAPGQFDLVITDRTMPGMTGAALARELLRIRPDLPIILCTGFSHTMTAEQAAALGIRAFVTKPYTVEDMAATIRRMLDRRAEDETTGSV